MAFGRYQSFAKKQPGADINRALSVIVKVAAQYPLDTFWMGQYDRNISERQWQFAARSKVLRQRFEGTEDAMADKRRDATKQWQPNASVSVGCSPKKGSAWTGMAPIVERARGHLVGGPAAVSKIAAKCSRFFQMIPLITVNAIQGIIGISHRRNKLSRVAECISSH